MHYYSAHALLLVLTASILAVTPSVAVRGTTKMMTRRTLQAAGDAMAPPEPKEAKDVTTAEEKTDKVEKEDKMPKEANPKKGGKKEKKACKKAADKDKKSKKDNRRSRQLETLETLDEMEGEDVFVGDVNELDYCLQGELSVLQCADLASIPSDGKVVSALKIGLVHNDEKHPETITQEAEAILDSGEMESRFVGCKDMDVPPPPPPKKGPTKENDTRRRIARRTVTNSNHRKLPPGEHEVIFKSAEEEIDVTGIDFRNLKIVRGGKLICIFCLFQ
jgi:hypothetical protein